MIYHYQQQNHQINPHVKVSCTGKEHATEIVVDRRIKPLIAASHKTIINKYIYK